MNLLMNYCQINPHRARKEVKHAIKLQKTHEAVEPEILKRIAEVHGRRLNLLTVLFNPHTKQAAYQLNGSN